MSEETPQLRGYAGGWAFEDALKEHAFSLELAYHIGVVLKENECEHIVDFGAGPGFYAAFLKWSFGFRVWATDAKPINNASLCLVTELDLTTYEAKHFMPFDAVLCLEVGEHIPAEHEAKVLDNIANSAKKKIILSWAVEGQTGFGHVNCRNNDYIIDQMAARGWKHNIDESDYLRERCAGCDWFQNTIMVFER